MGILGFARGIAVGAEWAEHKANRTEPWPIWYENEQGVISTDMSRGPYMPTWQSSPIIYNDQKLNENILRSRAMPSANLSYHTGEVVIGDFVNSIPGYYDSDIPDTALFALLLSIQQEYKFKYRGDPIGEIFFPVFDSFKGDRRVKAILVAWIHWKSYFHNILPHNIKGIIFVLHNTCGGSFTYELVAEDVSPIGPGDLHDIKFDTMQRHATFEGMDSISDGTKYGLTISQDRCSVNIDVYPTQKFYDSYNTATPIIMTCAVAIIFVFTALMFLFYDRLVERRQKLVMQKAVQTNAIVASLFPENVRERLMQQAASKAEVKAGKGGDFIAPNHRLKGYLSGNQEDDIDDTPIADLFPYCTVLFADIAGFTAWSSTRDPAQVFILLQTVYQAFDKIAKRRKVFKVETIGDSYVAVTGLPEPQANHAIIMARLVPTCWTCSAQLCIVLYCIVFCSLTTLKLYPTDSLVSVSSR
jgi:hypothetical protein